MSKAILLALALCLCGIPASAIDAQAQKNPTASQEAEASARTEGIINDAAQSAGLAASFGNPAWFLEAGKNKADILVEFTHGPLPDLAAAEFGLMACARLAQNAVLSGSGIRRMGLTVTSPLPDGRIRVYGTAIYNGNLAALIWENAGLNLEAATAPKIDKKAQKSLAANNRAEKRPMQGMPLREEIVEEEVVVIDPTAPQGVTIPKKSAPGQKAQAAQQQGKPLQEDVAEEIVIITPQAKNVAPGQATQQDKPQGEIIVGEEIVVAEDQKAQKPRFGQPMLQPRGVRQFPQNLTPGAIMPKPKNGNGQARQENSGCPYLERQPQTNCRPYLNSLAQPGAKPAPSNRANPVETPNPAAQNPALASYSSVAQAILNDTAAETGVQDAFGNPAFWLNAKDKEAEMMVQFRNGPLPANAARIYGLNACANLAGAYISKGIAPRRLTLTVTSVLPRGAMMIYGTAIYNGSLPDITWQNFGLTVGPGPFNGAMPAPPFVQKEMPQIQQKPQRQPLNVRRLPERLPITQPAQPDIQGETKQPQQEANQEVVRKQEKATNHAANEANIPGGKIDENSADDASYSYPAKSIINGAARAIGLQSSYGLPECSVVAGDYKADILVRFKHGPMPDSQAASFGRLACERLARAYIVKGLGTRHLAVTVSYTLEDGRRYDYGTAVFDGSLDDISWLAAGRII